MATGIMVYAGARRQSSLSVSMRPQPGSNLNYSSSGRQCHAYSIDIVHVYVKAYPLPSHGK